MKAFIRIGSYTAKAYDMGSDWQVLTSDGKEYWSSVWQADKMASLYAALSKACRNDSVEFDESGVVIA